MNSNYVLAMYDIRGKQEFIFRTNRLKEIVGGSCIIRDCFVDYLYPAAESVNNNNKGIYHENTQFLVNDFEKHINEGYIGEVVYDGGGNFLVLFKDEDIFKDVTYAFTKKVYQEIGTLRILGTYVKIKDFKDFKGDRRKLYEKHRKNENMESNMVPCATLPIVQVDTRSSQPLVDKKFIGGKIKEKVSREILKKYDKFEEEKQKESSNMGTKFLDYLVTKKGEESMLAIIYIDGNNMGAKVQECCEEKTSYEECIAALREFSMDIQRIYIDERLQDIDKWLEERYKNQDNNTQNKKNVHRLLISGGEKNRRLVLGAGDEINLICNARDAFEIVKLYLDGLEEEKVGASSCAGISIFHSHAPYADAYRIAEECCESGKQEMKKCEVNNASLVDFHYCQGAIGTSLEDIREHECETDSSRPWIVNITSSEKEKMPGRVCVSDEIEKMKDYLNVFGRSNIKGLMGAAKSSEAELMLEMKRMVAHMDKGLKEKHRDVLEYVNKMNAKKLRKLVFDMVTVYDLWFKED